MGLLKEIQKSIVAGGELGPILLKLRFLAAKLGSDPLEEWVKHESEGYPNAADLPDYRKLGVSYIADFSVVRIGNQKRSDPLISDWQIRRRSLEHLRDSAEHSRNRAA